LKKFKTILLLSFILICLFAYSQADKATGQKSDLSSLDIYAKVVGVVLTGLGALFGLPLAVMNFKKTKAEIRKLEREAEALTLNRPDRTEKYEGYNINIEGSKDVVVSITADPRFLGPLLLLLDFIIAWVIITLISYFLGIFIGGFIKSMIILLTACVLLIPILKESIRVRNLLKPKKPIENEVDNNLS
jgi:hypothetical protein